MFAQLERFISEMSSEYGTSIALSVTKQGREWVVIAFDPSAAKMPLYCAKGEVQLMGRSESLTGALIQIDALCGD